MRWPAGLKVQEVTVGAGALAERGKLVTVSWRGTLNRGEEFGGGTYSFQIGKRRVIAGLERGVVGMRVGGIRRLRVSPHLAYRDQQVPGVPANAVLNIEVQLLDVTEPEAET